MTRLFLCRHAEVEERYYRVFGGRINMGLSSRGLAQAESLARWLAKHSFDSVYASPMQRVQLTIVPCLPQFSQSPVCLDTLREVDFGDWTGCGWDEIQQRFGSSAYDWLQLMESNAIPNCEPIDDFRARVGSSLQTILKKSPEQTVAVFAHGGVIRMLLSLLIELPLSKFEHVEIDYASVTCVNVGEIKAGRPRTEIQLLNLTPWRDL